MFRQPFSFKGRIRRTEYALSYLLFLAGIFIISILSESTLIGDLNGIVYFVAIYWFLISQSTKRCHDLDQNGFYQLIPLYFFVLLFSEGLNRKNKYGQDPKLTELEEQQKPKLSFKEKTALPKSKTYQLIGSELLVGVLLTTLLVAFTDVYFSEGIYLFIYLAETVAIATGFFLLLYLSNAGRPQPNQTYYKLIYRFIFSVVLAICIGTFRYFFLNNLVFGVFELIKQLFYIVSIFCFTYLGSLIYSATRKKSVSYVKA